MARSTPARKAWRSLTWLGVIAAGLIGLNLVGVLFAGGTWLPKLALDLQGGTQIILAPKLESGASVSAEQLDQAVSIIRQRIDASGVSESEINTQGTQNIVVSLPGTPDREQIARIESSAKLEFRPVIFTDVAAKSSANSTPPAPNPSLATTPTVPPTNASDPNWISPALAEEYKNFDCSSLDRAKTNVAPANKPLITCESDGKGGYAFKYALGPVEVSGETIADASSGTISDSQGNSTGQWGVFITFNDKGTKQFADVTQRLFGFDPNKDPRNRFAIVLDGKVISAPTTNAVISNGKPQISGNFTQQSAKTLADQLKFGALPIGFEVQSRDTISATLGSSQLFSGLLAGFIGLILVVVYSLVQYRTLGFVTIASLVVAAGITYLFVDFLSWREGYRLSLAGVAGLIVAIGITADSFIVYFERIRDELRDGRGLPSAVEAGWKRAIRTILASDAVNFLAAGILFVLAVGNVRGFALTLGITTVVDLVVVSLFTHPVLQLLAQTRFFGEGHPLSGLDSKALGAVYRGRAQFRAPVGIPASKQVTSGREAAKRQTIAERKAAEAEAALIVQAKASKSGKSGKGKSGSKGRKS
ncbi:MAG: protein translocase subunit SecD [Salinibacterium sp.]|nr:MAG: protein translocase subunit SecD [Salinibacterium sp.]